MSNVSYYKALFETKKILTMRSIPHGILAIVFKFHSLNNNVFIFIHNAHTNALNKNTLFML